MVDSRSLRGVKDESTDNTYFRIAPFRSFGEGPPGQHRLVPEGVPGHAGGRNAASLRREWSRYAELLIQPSAGVAVGLHNNNANKAERFDEARAGLDHISFQVQGREGLEAWGDWLDSLGIAHSGIQSKKEPFVYSTIMFRDLDKIQLEFVAIDV